MTYTAHFPLTQEHPEYYMPRVINSCPECGEPGRRRRDEDDCFCANCDNWFKVSYVF